MHLSDILSAARVIAGTATRTPLVPAPAFAAHAGQPFLLKLETTQPIGAFKLRGALNALAHLPKGTTGVTCCSTGNHGRGVAYAARARGLKAVVCMSALVPQTKVDGIRALGPRCASPVAARTTRLPKAGGLRKKKDLSKSRPSTIRM